MCQDLLPLGLEQKAARNIYEVQIQKKNKFREQQVEGKHTFTFAIVLNFDMFVSSAVLAQQLTMVAIRLTIITANLT